MNASEEISNFLGQFVEYEISLEITQLFFCGGINTGETENDDEKSGKTLNSGGNDSVSFLVTWSGHVFKFIRTLEELKSPIIFTLNLHTTPLQCFSKLRNNPVMIKLCRNFSDSGASEIVISKCFCDSILCEEFAAQSLDQDLKFRLLNEGDTTTARGSINFHICKNSNDLTSERSDMNLSIEEDVAKKFEGKCNTFCESFKVTRSLTKNCRNQLEEFYNSNF